MKTSLTHTALAVLGFAITAAFTSPAFAADAAKPAAAAQPNADQILRQMSDTLAGAKQFTFKAHRTMDAALVPSGAALANTRIEVAVQRPNHVTAHATGGGDARRFAFDGRTFSLLDEKKNLYATVPIRATIDGLVNEADEVYGFTMPLAEFVLSNPYKDLRHQADAASYLGRATHHANALSAGIECHRLALTGKIADAELWVGVADHLPYRLVATFKNHPDRPQLKADFSSWNLAAKTSAGDFAFVPPKGAVKIEMVKKN